jgi:hypothetical protein
MDMFLNIYTNKGIGFFIDVLTWCKKWKAFEPCLFPIFAHIL